MNWISVENKLPEGGKTVIACDRPFSDLTFIKMYIYSEENEGWYQSCMPGEPADNITHWMPLPEPPTE